jgi:hypothetical protein
MPARLRAPRLAGLASLFCARFAQASGLLRRRAALFGPAPQLVVGLHHSCGEIGERPACRPRLALPIHRACDLVGDLPAYPSPAQTSRKVTAALRHHFSRSAVSAPPPASIKPALWVGTPSTRLPAGCAAKRPAGANTGAVVPKCPHAAPLAGLSRPNTSGAGNHRAAGSRGSPSAWVRELGGGGEASVPLPPPCAGTPKPRLHRTESPSALAGSLIPLDQTRLPLRRCGAPTVPTP